MYLNPRRSCYKCGHRKEDCDCWGGGFEEYEEGFTFSQREYENLQEWIRVFEANTQTAKELLKENELLKQEVVCLKSQLDQYIKTA